MANLPINCFPRNVTLERSSEGYALLGEIDKHDVVEDVYLNLYNEKGERVIAVNNNKTKVFSNLNLSPEFQTYIKDGITWSSTPPYHENNYLIKSLVKLSELNSFSVTCETPEVNNYSKKGNDDLWIALGTWQTTTSEKASGGITIIIRLKIDNNVFSSAAQKTSVNIKSSNSQGNALGISPNTCYLLLSEGANTSDNGIFQYELSVTKTEDATMNINFKSLKSAEPVLCSFSTGTVKNYYQFDLNLSSSFTTELKKMSDDSGNLGWSLGAPSQSPFTSSEYSFKFLYGDKDLFKINEGFSWSYTLQFQDYERYVLSGYTDVSLKQINDNNYIGIPNASGIESNQMFNNEYLIEVFPASKYYWNQRVEEIEKTGPVNGFYTYKVSWTGDKLPTSQKDYLKISVNTYVYDLKKLSEYSIEFESKIDLLGEEVKSAKVVILLYTPMTYITLKNLNNESISIDDNFKNLEYIITSNLLEGEINSFKIADSGPGGIYLNTTRYQGIYLYSDSLMGFNFNWFKYKISSQNKMIYQSPKIFETRINEELNGILPLKQKIDAEVIYQLKNGILKFKKISDISPEMSTWYIQEQKDIVNMSHNSVSLPLQVDIVVFSFYEKEGKYYDFYFNDDKHLNIEKEDNIWTISLQPNLSDSSSTSVYTFNPSEKIFSSKSESSDKWENCTLASSYLDDKIIHYISFPVKIEFIAKEKNGEYQGRFVDSSKNFLKDYEISPNSKYILHGMEDNNYCPYIILNSIDEDSGFSLKGFYDKDGMYIFYDNRIIKIQEGKTYLNEVDYIENGILYSGSNILPLTRYVPTNSSHPCVVTTTISDSIDFIPTCLFGTKYNYEENKENRYEVDPEQIWYFDLDTKANSIDFVNEHTVQPTLSGLSKVGISPTNYMSQTITTKLGYLDEDDMYVGDDGWNLNKFAEWANDGSVKILRLRNGYLIPVDIQLKTNVANHNVVGEPSDITFTWTQIADHKTAVLYGYE